MKFLFVTPEYPTLFTSSGGLSSHLGKFTALLVERGHSVHVVTFCALKDFSITEYNGVKVYSVPLLSRKAPVIIRVLSRLLRIIAHNSLHSYLAAAKAIGAKANELMLSNNYDVIQFSDHKSVGLYLKIPESCLSVCRLSSAADLYSLADGIETKINSRRISVEYKSILNARILISPSELVASHVSRRIGRGVVVIRPPAGLLVKPESFKRPNWLPSRYLFHFAGWLSRKKGSHLALQGLRELVKQDPSVILVVAGAGNLDSLQCGFDWNELTPNLLRVSALEPRFLYPAIASSCGVVLPSLVDNIPNAAIEAKLLDKPIISIQGNSIDELTSASEDIFISSPDPIALARAMRFCWLSRPLGDTTSQSKWIDSEYGSRFSPDSALGSYLDLIKAKSK